MVGHWSAGAEYFISIQEDIAFAAPCPPSGVPVGEPEIVSGYVDTYKSGWTDPTNPDTDWFAVTSPVSGYLEIQLFSPRPGYVIHLEPPDCDAHQVQEWGLPGHGEAAQIGVPVVAHEPVRIFVGARSCTSDFWPEVDAFDDTLTISVPSVSASSQAWGAVKSRYR